MLERLGRLVEQGLEATNSLFAPIETAYSWVLKAASLLENPGNADVLLVRRGYRQLLAEVGTARQSNIALLAEAATQFVKVSRSYWKGLFHCYSHPDLPRTNNASEQGFGSFRYAERRATGRKVTSVATVLRGQVRFVASATRLPRPFEASELRPHDVGAWRKLRTTLEEQQDLRRKQRRFRRDPDTYLATIEEQLLKVTLPT